jgi:hypothetical protein
LVHGFLKLNFGRSKGLFETARSDPRKIEDNKGQSLGKLALPIRRHTPASALA